MSFKDISYLVVWQSFCSMERNHLCNFDRVYHEEQFCEIIFEFGPVVQEELPLKHLLPRALLAALFSGPEPFVQF